MELWQLGALVGFGVGLIVLLVHLSGGSRRAVLESDAVVARRYCDDFPMSRTVQTIRTRTGDAGFLLLQDGSVGLVQAMGDAFLTRRLTPGHIKSATVSGPELVLAFDDFTFPSATFEFGDADQALALRQRLAP